MGDLNGFQKFQRALPKKQSVDNRLTHFGEFYEQENAALTNQQSSRCMDCGIPFCHSACPLGNVIPDFNHAVYKEDWKLAYEILSKTNNFPEFTGRICPAPCEASCVLNINNDPVTIEHIEKEIIEKAFANGWVKPQDKIQKNGKEVAVIGSGPAGLACAEELNKKGYTVTVFERSDKAGGLLRYGIPDFKLEKNVVDRRLEIMQQSGIQIKTGINVGYDISAVQIQEIFDAIVLTGGSTIARDLPIEGRQLNGVHQAMEYLEQKNRMVSGEVIPAQIDIDVKDKHVVVIGGGDTGADCVGTSNRLQAASVTQIEILAKPPTHRKDSDIWPNWPMVLRTSTSHEEGCDREWAILSKRFISEDKVNISGLEIVNVEWKTDGEGKNTLHEIPGSKRVIPCDVAFLAIGFAHPQKEGLLNQLGVALDVRGNVFTDNFKTSVENVYAAGDMRRGQSLVVWAIAEGRNAAEALHQDLSNSVADSSSLFV